MSTTQDLVSESFLAEQQEVERRLHAIMDAVHRKDFDALAAFHLDSPKFTKFDDFEPFERQDIGTANRLEAEGLGGVERFRHRIEDLQIDVFGPVAVATFVFDYGFEADGEAVSLRSRATMVFLLSGGAWVIAHEHFSPFPEEGADQG